MAASATFALKAGVWFRRGRLLIVSPDSLGTACPLSGRNSTYRPVQILEASSTYTMCANLASGLPRRILRRANSVAIGPIGDVPSIAVTRNGNAFTTELARDRHPAL